jgi:ketosteroid isomerase-like protein
MVRMSAANVDVARRGYESILRGDLDAVSELLAEDVKWHGGDPDAEGACRNRTEALAFMGNARRRGVGRLVDVIDAGDRVVVIIEPRLPNGDAAPVRANITTFRNGKVVEMIAYETPDAALEAAGLDPQSGYGSG